MDSNPGPLKNFDISTKANINASPRTWKGKLKEWGYNKNMTTPDMQWIVAKGKKRALEGKYTTFFHGVTHVTAQRIENFKRRKMREVSASARKFLYMQRL